ncbi:MAG: hypothetical protein RI911_408 [Candidatus Parcubacteria bacterium]|jgi:competence protein ComEC
MYRGVIHLCSTLALALAALVFIFVEFKSAEVQLKVVFLNVGQGDAIYIETPSKKQILIDGGKDEYVMRELGAVMPWFDRSLDVLVATHPDADHVGGLAEVVKRLAIGDVFYMSGSHDTPYVDAFEDALREKNITTRNAFLGDVISFGDGVYLHALHPRQGSQYQDTNDSSLVFRIVYRDISFLLTGDASSDIEHDLVKMYSSELKSTFLKAGHHGSDTSSSELFLGFVRPQEVIFSRGCDNDYGHPHDAVVARVKEIGARTYDTCTSHRVSVLTDGVGYTITTEVDSERSE